jgi:NCS1 family nucleobase:cation symporter-1
MPIESKSIDHVADHERHGRVIDQGPFWFLGNFQFFTIALGFVGPSMGLPLGYTALAGALGILFGTLFMAFHATQGTELGLPQMIQSRAQFGYRGVVIVLVGTLFTCAGFNVVDFVLVADGLHGILGWNPTAVIVVLALISAALAIYGHDWVHRIFKWCLFLCLPLYTTLTIAILAGRIASAPVAGGGFGWVAFAAQFAASASYNITYAPYVSDYSRYLPRATPRARLIAAVFVGASSSAIWLIALGAWLATRLGAADGLVALHTAGNALFAGFGIAVSLASVVPLVATMGMNTYSGMLTVLTGLNSLFVVAPGQRARITTIVGLTLAEAMLAIATSTGAIELLFAVLNVMLYLLVPWTSVNLVDYFFVRRGHYAITDLFRPNGIYGAWGGRGLVAYLVGFIASLPFLVLPGAYTGPAARVLGGVDVGWLVGLIISGSVYLLLCRSFDTSSEAAAIRASERILGTAGGT